jgi:serine/threonine protein kinase
VQIGSYEYIGDIGSGGMGKVILVRHLQTGHFFAMKFIHNNLLYHREGLKRFEREKRILQELSAHPHILPLVDSGVENNVPYYVMPYVDGVSLKERIEQGSIPIEECQAILRDVADALYSAHRRGILHRDIKPGNILLDKNGQAYLTDFGIAADTQASKEQLTLDLSQMGSIAYIAPEININGLASIQSEVYSLGALLYEMLTGMRLLEAMTRSDNYWSAIPEPIARVLRRATHHTISERFDNVRDFYYAFAGAVNELFPQTQPEPIAPIETNAYPATPRRTNKATIIVLVLALLLFVPAIWIITSDIEVDFPTPAADDSDNPGITGAGATVTRNVTSTRIASSTPLPPDTQQPTARPTRRPSNTPEPIPTTRTPRMTNTPIATPRPTQTPVTSITMVNASGTNLRSGPGTEFPVVAAADSGRTYNVIARSQDINEPWYLIAHNGRRAWVFSGVVQLNGANQNIPVAATIPSPP